MEGYKYSTEFLSHSLGHCAIRMSHSLVLRRSQAYQNRPSAIVPLEKAVKMTNNAMSPPRIIPEGDVQAISNKPQGRHRKSPTVISRSRKILLLQRHFGNVSHRPASKILRKQLIAALFKQQGDLANLNFEPVLLDLSNPADDFSFSPAFLPQIGYNRQGVG